jgi:hypothetical protein
MKEKLALWVAAALLVACITPCMAATDNVTTVTDAMKNFQTDITIKTDDVEQTFRDAFSENPELFYYFGGIDSPPSNSKKREITVSYLYTDVDVNSIFVVNDQEDLYNVIGLALIDTMTEVPMVVTDSSITTEDIVNTIDQWRTDHYLAYMGFDGAYANMKSAEISTWTAYTLTLSYAEDTDTIQQWRTDTENKVLSLSQSLFAQDMPDYQKELLIHDYIVENCTYQETAGSKVQYTAYGCLVEGNAVCEGYAEAARLLFSAAGLESYYVEGAGQSSDHVWNCVVIEDQPYWVDLTWDDPVPADGESETLSHDYFNLNDSQMNVDHSWQYAKYPSCSSTVWNYEAVQEALETEEGEEAPIYTDYSTKNVTTLETLRADLIYQLDIDESVQTTMTAPETTASAQDGEESADATTAPTTTNTAGEKSGGGAGKVILVIVIILVILVVAYLIYRRIMYLRMLARKRARKERARREAARQNGQPYYAQPSQAPRSSQSSRSGGKSSARSGRSSTSRSSSQRRRENPFR